MINGFSGPTIAFFPPCFRNKFLTWVQGEDRLTGRINYTDKQFDVGGKELAGILDDATNFNIVKIDFLVPAPIYTDIEFDETSDPILDEMGFSD